MDKLLDQLAAVNASIAADLTIGDVLERFGKYDEPFPVSGDHFPSRRTLIGNPPRPEAAPIWVRLREVQQA